MNTCGKFLKKYIYQGSIFIIISVLGLVSFLPSARAVVPATVPVGDLVNLPNHITTAVAAKAQMAKEEIGDSLLNMAAKVLIRQMTTSIVTWINSGFKGSPSFVQDPQKFLTNVGDEVGGRFLYDVAPFLCEPFRLKLQMNLALNYSSRYKHDTPPCTITKAVNNAEGFMKGQDFNKNGGWDSFAKVSQNPQNNPYGSQLQAQGSMGAEITDAKGNQVMQLGWGSGFRSMTDGFNRIITPGATISASLNKALGAGQDQLVTADEINEIVGALVGQLISQMMGGKGIAGAGADDGSGWSVDDVKNSAEFAAAQNRASYSAGSYTKSDGPLTLTVNGQPSIKIPMDQKFTDPGAKAVVKNDDGSEQEIRVHVDNIEKLTSTLSPGTFKLNYWAETREDMADGTVESHKVELGRTVIVTNAKPYIKLVGEKILNISYNKIINEEALRATAILSGQNMEQWITADIKFTSTAGATSVIATGIYQADIKNKIDTKNIGTYTITYSVKNGEGEAATTERTVNIVLPKLTNEQCTALIERGTQVGAFNLPEVEQFQMTKCHEQLYVNQ